MPIPVNITSEVASVAAGVTAASPLASASRILVSALQTQGAQALSDIDIALAAAGGALDAADPSAFPSEMIAVLNDLSTSSDDQTALADMRGLVGRAMFNLAQAGV